MGEKELSKKFFPNESMNLWKKHQYLQNSLEIVIYQYHIRSLLTHVCSIFAHGDTNIRLFQSNCVIHTISSHSNYVAVSLQRLRRK